MKEQMKEQMKGVEPEDKISSHEVLKYNGYE
jgi:hypothetical protein